MLYLSIAAVVVILAIAYKNELKTFFGKLKPRKKEVSTFRSAVNYSESNDNNGVSRCFCLIASVLCFIFGTLFGIFAFEAKPDTDTEPPIKEQIVTISDVKENSNNGCKYVKFSDGHTLKTGINFKNNTEWALAKEGDKVRKLIYANKEPEYTPEFDDNINKDSEK